MSIFWIEIYVSYTNFLLCGIPDIVVDIVSNYQVYGFEV